MSIDTHSFFKKIKNPMILITLMVVIGTSIAFAMTIVLVVVFGVFYQFNSLTYHIATISGTVIGWILSIISIIKIDEKLKMGIMNEIKEDSKK